MRVIQSQRMPACVPIWLAANSPGEAERLACNVTRSGQGSWATTPSCSTMSFSCRYPLGIGGAPQWESYLISHVHIGQILRERIRSRGPLLL